MPDSFVIYKTWGGLEWSNRYYVTSVETDPFAQAIGLAEAESAMVSDDVVYKRFEMLNPAGIKVAEGDLGVMAGVVNSPMLPIHWCALLRLNTLGPKRPSVKYLHGITEDETEDGEKTAAFDTRIAQYLAGLEEHFCADSDGSVVYGVTFRGWSRRKRMRRPTL